MNHVACLPLIAAAALALAATASAEEWAPVRGHIMTPFAKDVSPENAWPEHPRPQMVRKEWRSLNGLWDYRVEDLPARAFPPVKGLAPVATMTDATPPGDWDGRILVPFAIDAPLSGVMKVLRPTQRLWYRRRLELPASWRGRRVLLHFEAVDWEASVYVNGKRLGQHRGGYDPFTLDATDALKAGANELVVAAWDPTERQAQAIGKQIMPENRKGFRYQPTGGIWQSVWMEAVPAVSIRRLKTVPDVDSGCVRVTVTARGEAKGCRVALQALDGEKVVAEAAGRVGEPIALKLPSPKLWSPDEPFLYGLRASLTAGGGVPDRVESYFGLRKISLAKDGAGVVRICLNDKPIFQFGPLDQGYWPDGILTPPSDAAARFDVAFLKRIGCNMARVHVKVHPERWYHWCDRLGLLVWQDMVCMPKYGQAVTPEASKQWLGEFGRVIDALHHHPSIVMWVPFNEGWGQHDTPRIARWVRRRDPTRLVNNASGWADFGVGDVLDVHDYSYYPSVPLPRLAGGRAVVLGEAGGFNRCLAGHTWHADAKATEKLSFVEDLGRSTYGSAKTMAEGYAHWVETLRCLHAGHGLCAVVYTQITDVEHELNGWLTYDRKETKLPVEMLRAMHLRLYRPPKSTVILPLGGEWKYVLRRPRGAGEWFAPDYNDAKWQTGKAPFGSAEQAPLPVRTRTPGRTLFLRRGFTLARPPRRVAVRVQGRSGCSVYLNGKRILALNVRARTGQVVAGDVPLRPEAAGLLRAGRNVLAVEPTGRRAQPMYFDAALLELSD